MITLLLLCIAGVFGNPDSSRIQLINDKEIKVIWYTSNNEISRAYYMPSKFGLTVKDLIEEGEKKDESPTDLGGIWEHTVKLDDL